MKIKKSIITFICSSILLSQVALPLLSTEEAEASFQPTQLVLTQDTVNLNNFDNNPLPTTPQVRSATGIAIYLGGLLVGWIVDGVVIYATGNSSSEWIANGLTAALNYYNYGSVKRPLGTKSMYLTRLGKFLYYSGRSGSF